MLMNFSKKIEGSSKVYFEKVKFYCSEFCLFSRRFGVCYACVCV